MRDVVFLSALARERVLREAPFMERAAVSSIHEGVDAQEFRPDHAAARMFRSQFKLGNEPFLLAVGALSAEKRYDFLFDCLATLGDRAPLLLVCGEGSEEFRLRQRAATLRLNVRFHGRVPRHSLIGAYNAACALIHAGSSETFGLAVLEAMACGRPIIAAAGGALPEVLGANGECGMLVPPQSALAFVDAIRAVENEPLAAQARALRARRRATTQFSLRRMEDSYARVVGRHFAETRR